jgi:hypothetical protein
VTPRGRPGPPCRVSSSSPERTSAILTGAASQDFLAFCLASLPDEVRGEAASERRVAP